MNNSNHKFTNEESQLLHVLDEREKEAKAMIEKTNCWKVKNDRQKQLARIRKQKREILATARKRGQENNG